MLGVDADQPCDERGSTTAGAAGERHGSHDSGKPDAPEVADAQCAAPRGSSITPLYRGIARDEIDRQVREPVPSTVAT